MWFYSNDTRKSFERRKDYVQAVMMELGAEIADIELSYEQKSTSYVGKFVETYYSVRPVFTYRGRYYRVDEALFREKPFIVLECGTLQEVLSNGMEDTDPFPYDLPNEEIEAEIRYVFGIDPYPATVGKQK